MSSSLPQMPRSTTSDGHGPAPLTAPRCREIRVALCKRCNFDCFFCHSEGLDRGGDDPWRSTTDILDLVRRAGGLGFSDVTFTGGEPLLRWRDLESILRALAREPRPPSVTVVTNASAVTDAFVAAACDYPGRLKFNVSLHAATPTLFRQITRSEVPAERVLENVARLTRAGLRVKLNTVVLNGLNSGVPQMAAHLGAAQALGVSGVKFLELLVTPANRSHYGCFYSEEAIVRDLAQLGFAVSSSNQRTRILSSTAMPGLVVEVTRCTCKIGCADCASLRDRQFGSDLRYYPCFVQSAQGLEAGPDSPALTAALRAGDEAIARYARAYGMDSPILVPHEHYVKGTEEVFFLADLPAEACDARLRAAGCTAAKRRDYHMVYCLPQRPDEEWLLCRRVLKYGYDAHTPNKFELIFSQDEYHSAGETLVCVRTYLTPEPVTIPAYARQEADAFIRAFGYAPWFERSFRVVDYECVTAAATLSVDTGSSPLSVKVPPRALAHPSVTRALQALGAQPVTLPFTAWLARQAQASPAPVVPAGPAR